MRPTHDRVIDGLLPRLALADDRWPDEGLTVLRATVMNPFFGERDQPVDHLAGFVDAVATAAGRAVASGPRSG